MLLTHSRHLELKIIKVKEKKGSTVGLTQALGSGGSTYELAICVDQTVSYYLSHV